MTTPDLRAALLFSGAIPETYRSKKSDRHGNPPISVTKVHLPIPFVKEENFS
ncbi:hypothetical protein [Picosynechococcus sp. PCC 7117]|uniref:hypothetical protein n=1 Tax=Picosynechococcus sp. PCC 7117 TaxID=195498 RepID=UPI000B13E31D|nr:hypothetical protein [Picosynechococcus sp. PCC 7117]